MHDDDDDDDEAAGGGGGLRAGTVPARPIPPPAVAHSLGKGGGTWVMDDDDDEEEEEEDEQEEQEEEEEVRHNLPREPEVRSGSVALCGLSGSGPAAGPSAPLMQALSFSCQARGEESPPPKRVRRLVETMPSACPRTAPPWPP